MAMNGKKRPGEPLEKDAKKARQLAAHAGDELETLAKQGAERGNAMWQLALDIGRRSLESLARDEKPRKAKAASKAKKAAPKAAKKAVKKAAKKSAPKKAAAKPAAPKPAAPKPAAPMAAPAPEPAPAPASSWATPSSEPSTPSWGSGSSDTGDQH